MKTKASSTSTPSSDESQPVSQEAATRAWTQTAFQRERCLIMLCMKSSSTEPVASTSTRPIESNDVDRPKPILVRNRRPTQAFLEKMGIKVRDFAYEKTTLPALRSTYVPQVQPAVNRPVQRQSTEPDETVFSQESQDAHQIEPAPTEPAMTPALVRHRALWDSDDFEQTEEGTDVNSQLSLCSRRSPITDSQLPEAIFDSQESAAIVNTPLVTPHGSLQLWDVEDTSNIPASQLDTNSQVVEPEVFSYSQLGFSQPAESSQQDANASNSRHAATPSPLSPLTSLASSSQSSMASLFKTAASKLPQTLPLASTSLRTNSITDLRLPNQTTNRYDLRKRPSPTSATTAKPSKRMKFPDPPFRSNPVAIKSMHLQQKANAGSSSTCILRQTGTAKGRGKGKAKARQRQNEPE